MLKVIIYGFDGLVAYKDRRALTTAVGRAARKLARRVNAEELADLADSLASPHRVRLLYKLLEGPQTYQALQESSGLKAGPLYFHIGKLRQTGLVAPKQRNQYVLTTAGLRVTVVGTALPRLVRGR